VTITPAAIRTAALRSLSAAPNVFAIESAIDELAARAGLDPLEIRLRNTDDPRLVRVLERVAERSGWAQQPRGAGVGRGLACAIYNDTYVAQVAEVEVESEARVHVRRAWCAFDCGTLIDPDGARNQIEGSIVHATSWALVEQLRHDAGRVLARSWDDYPIARFHDAPTAIDVVFTDDGVTAPTGVGEPAAVPFGAAIANAVAAACSIRVRTQPITARRLVPGVGPRQAHAVRASHRASCAVRAHPWIVRARRHVERVGRDVSEAITRAGIRVAV
jgi:CO/xanthine dehydrogenase Mo-binding subunit